MNNLEQNATLIKYICYVTSNALIELFESIYVIILSKVNKILKVFILSKVNKILRVFILSIYF